MSLRNYASNWKEIICWGIRMRLVLCIFALAITAFSAPVTAQVTPFDIVITYTQNASDYQSAFEAAEARWESIITGWTDGVNIVSNNGGNSFYNVGDNLSSLFINAGTFDGSPGGVLGSAGPTEIVNDGSVWLASHGAMNFDTADLDNLQAAGSLEDVILHEMGHVLGIGTLWTINDLYDNGTGEYDGANGVAQYQTEFNNDATFVPVELGGGGGTANGHWDETRPVSAGDTVLDPNGLTVIDPNNINFGKSRTAALMTGFLDSGADTFISNTTGGSLQDLGYDVSFAAIQGVPEPSSAVAIAFLGLVGLRRRRR